MSIANLLMEFSIQVSPSDEDGNDPEQACEENVKSDEEQEKPPDRRHLATVLSSRYQVVSHDHRELLASGAQAGCSECRRGMPWPQQTRVSVRAYLSQMCSLQRQGGRAGASASRRGSRQLLVSWRSPSASCHGEREPRGRPQ